MSHTDRIHIENLAKAELIRIHSITLNPKARLGIPVQDMPNQDPDIRRATMGEVATGYSREQAMVEEIGRAHV